MSRRYAPDGSLLIPAILARVDSLEQATSTLNGDVTAIGRGLGDVTGQLRRLTDTSTPSSTADPAAGRAAIAAAGAGAASQDDDEAVPNWDWFAFTNPETVGLLLDPAQLALDMLMLAARSVRDVLCHYGIALPVACWSLHPTVVADLLSLHLERENAYASTSPTPVSEWLTRWVPAGRDRITAALGGCVAERGHVHAGRTYDTRGFDPYSTAAWWATRSTTDDAISDDDTDASSTGDGSGCDPVTAFGLTPL